MEVSSLEFREIKRIIEKNIPMEKIDKIDLEGPKVVLYTNDIEFFIDNDNEIRNLATLLKKRIILRSSADKLMDVESARKIILGIVPEEANISGIEFDPNFKEVYIEAEKLGLVIGKHGQTLDEIAKKTGWIPKLLRKPPIESETIRGIRKSLFESSDKRLRILQRVGKRIYRKPTSTCDWVRITPLGGAREVGRSCFLLQTPESNVLIDCGINTAATNNNRFPDLRATKLEIENLDAIIISHAHLDHCGFLPYLYKYGYKGPIYCTEPTRDLMLLLQLDAIEVSEREDKELPFSSNEIKKMLKYVITLDYNEVADITPDMRLTLYNAGHILGSAIVHLHVGDGLHNIVYTGDMKFGDTRLLEAANYEFPRVETLIIESTYGGRYDTQPNRRDAEKELINTIKETVKRGGKVLIPVFAVGRSQEVMMVLENYSRFEELEIPVFLDGMIWEATAIHTSYPEYLKRNIRRRIFNGYNPFLADTFEKVDPKKRDEVIESKEPCVILATSGMMTGGPSVEYFRRLAEDSRNTLAFVGYQAEGSLGRRIQNGLAEIPIERNGRTVALKINMHVKTIDGFSGHADRRQLLGYSKKITPRPRRALIIHGEEKKAINLAMTLHEMFGFESSAPQNLDTIRLV
ncbi:MAG: beta-CASP ribonuclease aCPSF1 [Candidatus Altiarchaeales archaeon]|nr:MAG: beta-CASP ribonuclease aCPSF1 [Candidatus Altiarchaeales archaeon]HDO82515.1 beta-CASP ribonuclease aCPSF1 [Candidatus Altiarchaeales archaeon]HEX55164.1 beta-CASP ribonuclease aCPSF1 [Candidatus Altiarchaeales archaeon]